MADLIELPDPPAPALRDERRKPEGVVPKQSQTYVIVVLALLILFAVMFSKQKPKAPLKSTDTQTMASTESSESNARKIEELKQDLNQEQRQSELAQKTASATANNAASTLPATGTTPTNGAASQPMPAPAEPPRDPIADAEKALAFKSRFASNLVSEQAAQHPSGTDTNTTEPPRTSGLAALDHSLSANADAKKHPEVNVNSASGQPFVLFEGTTIDTTLVNRLNGDFAGPIKVMVTNPVYSHDRQHVLIPEGSFILGDVQHIEGTGQRRIAVTFHRLLMPDGYSVDLDRFHALNQIGETGLNDLVNNHYLQIFGTSIALGIIAGAAESTTNAGYSQSGSDMYRQGVASSLSQSSSGALDRFVNVQPTITIREGHRIKVYLTQDLLLPAMENHTVPPNI